MADEIDLRKSIQDLEQDDWGEPTYASHLVTTCHRLRRKPLIAFTAEDLRIMIGQRMALQFLVPLALDVLEEDPLAAGDFYAGDLLEAMLKIDKAFWSPYPAARERIRGIAGRVKELIKSMDEDDRRHFDQLLDSALRPASD